MAKSNITGANAPTQLSELTDSELEQEFLRCLDKINPEQRAAICLLVEGLQEVVS